MKVRKSLTYPHQRYYVDTLAQWKEISGWMDRNQVKYLHEYSGVMGLGFSVLKNKEWFLLAIEVVEHSNR